MNHRIPSAAYLVVAVLAILTLAGCHAPRQGSATSFVSFGGMHEAVGQRHDYGRVALAEITALPHFYGVGALEGLEGEVTITDSAPVVTGVAADGRLQVVDPADKKATILAGQSVEAWQAVHLDQAIPPDRFDTVITNAVAQADLDTTGPLMFLVEGELTDVRLHVLNGACPVHARMKKIDLPPSEQAYELEAKTLAGTLIGVYATDSVGKLTHPATSTHVHIIYVDPMTGKQVTAHLEQVGLAAGAVLKLPIS
jgi:hypothetical protein